MKNILGRNAFFWDAKEDALGVLPGRGGYICIMIRQRATRRATVVDLTTITIHSFVHLLGYLELNMTFANTSLVRHWWG